MKKVQKKTTQIVALSLSAALGSTLLYNIAGADGDDWFPKVQNPKYQEECGSCHMAYPPALLPTQSWEVMMGNLDDHFGENAELEQEDQDAVLAILRKHSRPVPAQAWYAPTPWGNRATSFPLRISELPRFRHEHDEIPYWMVKNNPQVGSYSKCEACHTKAEQYSFQENEIIIPGYGRYED